MDPLSLVLQTFGVRADVFFTGNLCNLHDFTEENGQRGHLHILKSGALDLISKSGSRQRVNKPTVIFFPRGEKHRFVPDPLTGADIVCATLEYNELSTNPIAKALPPELVLSMESYPKFPKICDALFDEAFSDEYGRVTAINRWLDLFLIEILRVCLMNKLITTGLMAGLADSKLANAIVAIHTRPAENWTVDTLAAEAFMSRAKFAASFKQVIGQTPASYMLDWRMILARSLLKNGLAVSEVSEAIGYENSSAMARVFKKVLGVSPKQFQLDNM
ncbi:helix-turn-helix transcriptional regulator [Agaribacter marinus]|uniref:AraC family transcriptional regulator n=1 Tax=Agaribacter marinus TaxID=1431249 RepID=A0AA37T1V3_9ALTE|nr:AraC family transcriptional regulator [Agaribacter marinus]GLR72179.1 AraC family transcriptional regulator [Agaribacter marinus]